MADAAAAMRTKNVRICCMAGFMTEAETLTTATSGDSG